jgi:hypothetical protein
MVFDISLVVMVLDEIGVEYDLLYGRHYDYLGFHHDQQQSI